VFVIAAVMHALCALVMWLNLPRTAAADSPAAEDHAHVQPEPELLASRTLAMWLARICMPANYVVVNGLSAMMPKLAILRPLDTAERTAVGSVWMLARFLAFLYFGMTTWWHTRPRMLLVAASVMMVAFLGVTVRPSDVLGHATPYSLDLASMIAGQLALGAAMGMIYSASLYFGMVLSDGSTEHGGYHEALIGVGCVIGPGAAALTQIQWPGDIRAGITAVTTVIALSVLSAGIASAKASRRPTS
jgi:hypothetical protein